MATAKIPAPEVTSEGIRIALSPEEWILYQPDGWGMDDEFYFTKANDLGAFRIIVEKAKDWRIFDRNAALVPFVKQDLLDALDALDGSGRLMVGVKPLPKFPLQIQTAFNATFWHALREARALPLEHRSPSGS